MKLGYFAIATLLVTPLAAAQTVQDKDSKSKTMVIVEDGKEMTLTGCVQRGAAGGYILTNAADKDGALSSYMLAPLGDHDDAVDDLDKHVGHRMELTGKATNRGDGKIKVKTKSEVDKVTGGSAKSETTSEVKGDLPNLPYLGVKAARMIASVCP